LNTFKRRQAERLIKNIEAYWAKRGYPVRAWVSHSNEIYHDGRLMCIKSNMINGCPPGARGDVDGVFHP
jgi:hypothetical protein